MSQFDFFDLKSQYDGFANPFVDILVNDKKTSENKKLAMVISDLEIEMTSGFEASMARFLIYGAYSQQGKGFFFEDIKNYITLGSAVVINAGYNLISREIFRGFISRVSFIYAQDEIPGIEVTAMDVKGIMMANNNSKQLKSETYKEAIEEIFKQPCYNNMLSSTIITEVKVDKTPDMETEGAGGTGGAGTGGAGGSAGAGGGGEQKPATEKSIEMVAESDYEFVVKSAKKFNYEFFSVGGVVMFRQPRKLKDPIMVIGPAAVLNGLDSYTIDYDITGLVEKVEVRGVDVGKNKVITSSAKKIKNKISFGSKASSLIKDQQKVYIDPTIHSKEEADFRASYLTDEIAYRFGTLNAQFRGIPEITPGYYLEFAGFGNGVDNLYYIVNVRHIMDSDGGYKTIVKGCVASIDGSSEKQDSI